MQPKKRLALLTLFLTFWFLLGCDPLAPQPTAQVIIITPVPSATPLPTATPLASRTPVPTPTEIVTPSATPFPCDEAAGQILNFPEFRSGIANENLRYNVYVPPCYFTSEKRYPVVILLHGASYTETQWVDIGMQDVLDQGFRLGVLSPMVVVMPYTGRIGNDNTFPPEPSYEAVVLDELIPAIERDFCTWNDRQHRAIGGISRGGFWAYSLALRHPDIFGAVGGHSAAFTDDTNLVPPAFNPLELALNSSFLAESGLRLYLDNGANDFAGVNLQLFSSRLSSRGIPHTYAIHPVGEHDETYWSAHVSEYMAFYGRDWPLNAAQLPSCLEPSP
jgi:enterochelin esterase-like enzyme